MATISSIMTSRVITARADLPLYELICLLVDKNVGGVPVVDRFGKAIGMVSKSDLLWEDHDWAESQRIRAYRARHGHPGAQDEPPDGRNLEGRTVGDVMTSRALSVLPTAEIRDAAKLMTSNRVHRLPVVDELGVLVGIVTTFDLARWVAE